ncbi:MAG: hypothetical protein ACOYN0_16090, partial [Phycisphaerales bacterium]
DEYADRMATGRAYSVTVIVLIGAIVGAIATLCAFAAHWLYAWLVSGGATWTFSLIVGGVGAALTMGVLWFTTGKEDWTEQPPELATDVTATAYAAWRTESDSVDAVFVLRVEADRYLLITESAYTPPLIEEKAAGIPADTFPSRVNLVIMGEGEFRIAMNVTLTGLRIPLTSVTANPAEDDPDRFDETPIPDGLYMADELPGRIRRAIGVG